MPFAFCSPEWSNEKGVGAALSFRLMGIDSYHCVPAPVSGSETVRQFLDQGTRELLGGGMVVVPKPTDLAVRMLDDLAIRRDGLGWT
jgi:carbon-monoxide dehydrogenase catalytic subunit